MKQTKKQQQLYTTVLHKIYTRHEISRIDIARETGITPATVSLITADMLSERLIQEIGEEAEATETVGRKKILLSVAPSHSFYVGAEISEKFFSFVLTDNTGIVFAQETVFHERHTPMCASFFTGHLSAFLSKTPHVGQVKAIGIAIPGHYTKEHPHKIMTNNTYWQDFSLSDIAAHVQTPVFFSNNVHCMARAESLFYPPSDGDNSNFLFFHIGRGIHCTHMYHDDLYGKQNLKIGEIGHMIIQPDGELCECGKRGCLQTYASEAWLLHKARLLYGSVADTCLHQLVRNENEITLQTLLTAYDLGDDLIVKLLSSAIKSIGIASANLNMIIDSARIFIHGELFDNPKTVALLKSYLDFEPNLFTLPSRQQLIIKPYSPYTGAVGAAALAVCRSLLALN